MTTQELREARMGLIDESRKLLDAAEVENRNLSAEEQERYDKMDAEVDELQERVDRREKADRQKAWGEQSQGRMVEPGEVETAAVKTDEDDDLPMRAFRSYLRDGQGRMPAEEVRALQADNDTQAGYLIVPEQFVASLIQAKDNAVFMRQKATIHTLKYGQNLGMPSLDTDIEDATWTPEIVDADEDTALAFGKRELSTNQLTKLIKVSRPLLRSSAISAEQIVRERLAYKFSTTEENVFLNGTGAAQPLGVFTASDNGISTTYDISTGNTTTAIRFDGLIEAKYGLKTQYLASAAWIFHRDAVKQIRKLKDGDGQYIWQASVVAGEPDRILDLPFSMSEYAPSTFTEGLYVGILGDFKFYHIADSLRLELQRLDELYAVSNQVGFVGRAETDGMPVLGEAFRRVTLA